MKIKILNSSGWYNKNLGEEFEIEEINYDKDSNARFESKNNGWIYSEDCVITELPGEFCVRRCELACMNESSNVEEINEELYKLEMEVKSRSKLIDVLRYKS
jgi:hypothetical protein